MGGGDREPRDVRPTLAARHKQFARRGGLAELQVALSQVEVACVPGDRRRFRTCQVRLMHVSVVEKQLCEGSRFGVVQRFNRHG